MFHKINCVIIGTKFLILRSQFVNVFYFIFIKNIFYIYVQFKKIISLILIIGITSQTVNDIISYVDNNKKEKVISFINKTIPQMQLIY